MNGTGLFTPENYLGDLWRLDVDTATWEQLVFDEAGGPGHREPHIPARPFPRRTSTLNV